jgi:sugar lactone lactonase YvrE
MISAIPVETYAKLYAGTSGSGEGKVYVYQGGTNWTAISPSLGYAVLDILQFNGTLYAATTSNEVPTACSGGQVWRYDGGTSWTVVGDNMDNAVCSLETYNGQLYAGTANNGGKLYRYNGANFDYVGYVAYFEGIRAMYSSSYGYLQLGDIRQDIFGHYDGTNLYFDAYVPNESCVVDFAEYNNMLYAGTELDADVYGSTNGTNWSDVLPCPIDAYALWKLQPFQGQLYLGYGDGQLAYMDSSNVWHSVLTASDSIISMVATGNDMLYFGTGVEAVGDVEDQPSSGPGYVYAYTGNGATNATRISGPMGDGVQCLYYFTGLLITPGTGFGATGYVGGPFTVTNETFSLTNTGTNSLDWSLANTSSWLDASPAGGTLTNGGPAATVTVSLNSNAYSLTSGIYTATVWFTNLSDSVVQGRQFSLTVGSVPVITAEPSNQTVCAGSCATFSVAVSGTGPFTYQWQLNGANLPNGVITTVAGNGSYGHSGDGGTATNASLEYPFGVAADASGNLFIADTYNSVIRKVNINGIITTVAGNGTAAFAGDGGPATNASLAYPYGVAVDASGNLFIADTGNNRIRKVDTNGIITTVAGNGNEGYSGDGGAATSASLDYPSGVAADASGNLFIADTYNSRIRKVDAYGIITTVAGGGVCPMALGAGCYSAEDGDGGAATNALLSSPQDVAMDASGNLFIADSGNNRIRKVDTNGIITTVAGNGESCYYGDGGPATNASLNDPSGVAMDASSNLFIADSGSSRGGGGNRIRKVDTNGIITTVAGNGTATFAGDGGAATNASLDYPSGVAVNASGNLFIADSNNERIREVALFASYPTLTLCNVTSNNAGNYTVIITSPYGSVTSSVATLMMDSVCDGIPDSWRAHYFPNVDPTGKTTNNQSCATCDADGTGQNNLFKYLAGLNPTNPAAYLHIISIAETGNDINVTYLGASGDSTWSPGIASRTNVLEFTAGAADGSYSNNFESTGQTNILSGGRGLGVVTNMVDPGGATSTPSRYYRVRVLVP